MCLYLKENTKEKIANRDIVCYKVVYYDEIDKTCVVSQFERFKYMLGRFEYSQLDSPDARHRVFHGFHSYKYYEDALESIYAYGLLDCNYGNSWEDRWKVYKCIIPNGSHYYDGVQSSMPYDMVGYCSNQIVIQEIVEDAPVRSNRIIRHFDKFKTENPIWYYWLKIIGFGLLFVLSVMILSTYLENN